MSRASSGTAPPARSPAPVGCFDPAARRSCIRSTRGMSVEVSVQRKCTGFRRCESRRPTAFAVRGVRRIAAVERRPFPARREHVRKSPAVGFQLVALGAETHARDLGRPDVLVVEAQGFSNSRSTRYPCQDTAEDQEADQDLEQNQAGRSLAAPHQPEHVAGSRGTPSQARTGCWRDIFHAGRRPESRPKTIASRSVAAKIRQLTWNSTPGRRRRGRRISEGGGGEQSDRSSDQAEHDVLDHELENQVRPAGAGTPCGRRSPAALVDAAAES